MSVINIHKLYRPFHDYFRTRRASRIEQLVSLEGRILDIGGTREFWEKWMPPGKRKVVLLNLRVPPEAGLDKSKYEYVAGDGCELPFDDKSFDLCFSNSVIEHVGNFERQKAFAEEARRVGIHYCVQTPNRGFWFEPHLLTPFIHWLPIKHRKRLARRFSLWGLLAKPSERQAQDFAEGIRLLSRNEVRQIFPDGQVATERFLFMAKSFIVYR